MKFFSELKKRYIIDKSYNLVALRTIMYVCVMLQLLWTLLPMVLELPTTGRITSLILSFILFSVVYIVGYFCNVLLFYIIFKKYVNRSIHMGEKQIAPLLCLQMLIPFIFNLVGYFINMPNFSLMIRVLQRLISILYVSYLVFGKVFKEKCVMNMILYFVVDIVFVLLADLLKVGAI